VIDDDLFIYLEHYDDDELDTASWWKQMETAVKDWDDELDPEKSVHAYLDRREMEDADG
jgi:hypothetical protein